MITLVELTEKLKQTEETILLELLDVSSEELVDRFSDLIEEKYEQLVEQFEVEEEEE